MIKNGLDLNLSSILKLIWCKWVSIIQHAHSHKCICCIKDKLRHWATTSLSIAYHSAHTSVVMTLEKSCLSNRTLWSYLNKPFISFSIKLVLRPYEPLREKIIKKRSLTLEQSIDSLNWRYLPDTCLLLFSDTISYYKCETMIKSLHHTTTIETKLTNMELPIMPGLKLYQLMQHSRKIN